MKTFFHAAFEKETIGASIKVALVVGSILALINDGDRIFLHGDMRAPDWIKLALTYCVSLLCRHIQRCEIRHGACK